MADAQTRAERHLGVYALIAEGVHFVRVDVRPAVDVNAAVRHNASRAGFQRIRPDVRVWIVVIHAQAGRNRETFVFNLVLQEGRAIDRIEWTPLVKERGARPRIAQTVLFGHAARDFDTATQFVVVVDLRSGVQLPSNVVSGNRVRTAGIPAREEQVCHAERIIHFAPLLRVLGAIGGSPVRRIHIEGRPRRRIFVPGVIEIVEQAE
ncbi:MAG: hypothetical protein BWY06_03167 [Candidatus Latescibacteria bacterium ADurb.Bin168]|nr:MAG: hypothetical protein BWY06_03167 [Candidatus Latescibacteria bacterium ADurb.Bin168]